MTEEKEYEGAQEDHAQGTPGRQTEFAFPAQLLGGKANFPPPIDELRRAAARGANAAAKAGVRRAA